MPLLYWGLAFIGHVGLWCATFNFLHSTALVRWARKTSEIFVLAFLVFPVLFAIWQAVDWLTSGYFDPTLIGNHVGGQAYSFIATVVAFPTLVFWCLRKFSNAHPEAVIDFVQLRETLKSDSDQPLLHGRAASLLGLLPMNESLTLSTDRLTIKLDVPQSLDGLKITHLSDFHLTGQVDQRFFERVVEQSNAFDPDLIIISGDLVDNRECLSWIEPIFGALKSKHGCYFVLGNHDARVGDVEELCQRLKDAGLAHVGGRWQQLEINGASIEIAGNELPWFSGAEYLPLSADAAPGESGTQPDLKILISHSPDQLEWAKPFDFDLMFAGHNHGGQISFPLIGPIITPSRYGVRYAAGTFQIGPMLMHVSRGISAEKPIRWNSVPEVGLFTIRAAGKTT